MTVLTRVELAHTLAANNRHGKTDPSDWLFEADRILEAARLKLHAASDAAHEDHKWFPVREKSLAAHGFRMSHEHGAFRDGWDAAVINAEELGLHRHSSVTPEANESITVNLPDGGAVTVLFTPAADVA